MNRFVSPRLRLPEPIDGRVGFKRADVVLHEVDHSGLSYEGRLFFNAPEADASTSINQDSGYAGSFYVFGHWGCLGDEGHCEIPQGRLNAYDRRPLHKLTPYKLAVEVTGTIRRLIEEESARELTITVVPIPAPLLEDDDTSDVLHFTRLSLMTYE
jgi:hypothetical protein